MFSNIFKKNYQNIGFEDVLYAIKNKDKFLLINTLSHNEQNILIYNTISSSEEEKYINTIIEKNEQPNFNHNIWKKLC